MLGDNVLLTGSIYTGRDAAIIAIDSKRNNLYNSKC
jgi:tartrate dehydratase beta subunit/fumarate hydratase class I family protein